MSETLAPLGNSPRDGKGELHWTNILFMTLNPLAAFVLTPLYLYYAGFSWGLLLFLVITYTISNMSITCGYHRYFSHRSYDAHPFIEFMYVFFGAGAFQGSLLQWCTDHRRHHREVDSNEDPYTIQRGFWYAHLTWMFRKDLHPEADKYPKDLTKSRHIVFQHKYYALYATFVGYILPGFVAMALGYGFWGGVIIGGALRITLSQHSTFLINSAAHTFGRQTYTDKNSAKDSLIMAFLTFGEGYHNFHHYFQADYRNGIRWYQWDPTKWWIKVLSLVGLASRLKQTRKDEILKARLNMEERLLVSSGVPSERVQHLKTRLVEAQAKVRQMHEEYLNTKKALRAKRQEMARQGRQMTESMRLQMRDQLERLRTARKLRRADISMAKHEFASAYMQWREFRKSIRRTPASAA